MHHCSSSANPAFTYSPLLNEQHSRRRSRLQYKEFLKTQTEGEPNVPQVEQRLKSYLLNNWTLMNEKICVNTLLIKNEGTC